MVNDDIIINHLIEGLSCPQIAKLYNIDKQRIQRRVRKLTLPTDVYIKHQPSNKPFTQSELDVLIGGLLGDSWIGHTKKSKNSCGSFTHKIEHKDYVYYKYNLLNRLCSAPRIYNKFDKRTNRKYQQCFCKIATNPLLNDIHSRFYINGNKVVDEIYLKELSPLAIAIWFMDDGSKTAYGYKISTDCFELIDVKKLVNWLKSFEINCTINSEKAICIRANSRLRFTNLIKQFVPFCMEYKLHIK